MFESSKHDCPFERELPGGGFVAIEVVSTKSLWGKPTFQGRVIVERRSTPRGSAHSAPVIATATASTLDGVMRELFPVAQSNASIGAALLRLGPLALDPQPIVR